VEERDFFSEFVSRLPFAILGWLLPGVGHFARGERLKGALFFVTLLGCFAAGEFMSEFRAVSRVEHKISFYAQIGMGGPTLLCVWYDKAYNRPGLALLSHPIPVPRLLDCGIMYTCVAGLLNFVLVVDLLFPLSKKGKESSSTKEAEET